MVHRRRSHWTRLGICGWISYSSRLTSRFLRLKSAIWSNQREKLGWLAVASPFLLLCIPRLPLFHIFAPLHLACPGKQDLGWGLQGIHAFTTACFFFRLFLYAHTSVLLGSPGSNSSTAFRHLWPRGKSKLTYKLTRTLIWRCPLSPWLKHARQPHWPRHCPNFRTISRHCRNIKSSELLSCKETLWQMVKWQLWWQDCLLLLITYPDYHINHMSPCWSRQASPPYTSTL